MTAPDRGIPNTNEGPAYTTDTVSDIQGINAASAYSVMNSAVLAAFSRFGVNTSAGLASTANSIGSTVWGSAISTTANSALSGANSANSATQEISSGVSGNITGAATGTTASSVGPAVQLLNATVQASGSAPRVDVFNQAGRWTQPTGLVTANIMLIAGGGGGAQGGISTTTGSAGGGGGAGAWSEYNGIAASSMPTQANVVVGLGGTGGSFTGGAVFEDHFQRPNSSTLGAYWRTDSGSANMQVVNDQAQTYTPSSYVGENGCWSTYITPFNTDNYMVTAQLGSPSTSLATNNYTGIYLAAPTSWGSGSVAVAFVGNTSTGCGIITQTGAPASPYVATGTGTGQTIRVQTATTFTATSLIALSRVGNTFTAYIDGTQVLQWTDSGNIVPTGSANRLWGIVIENNWPTFQSLYESPAISDAKAQDIPGWSNPGTAGGLSSFNATAYQAPGGAGGVGGGYDAAGTRRPATGSFLNTDTGWTGANGTGNQTNTASGGVGAAGVTGYQPSGQQGGAGYNTPGGLPGTATSLAGSPGTGPSGGRYAPGSGGGGGYWISGQAGQAGAGAAGGFPAGGGGGGGASLDAQGTNGNGGPGGDGQVVITSNFT